MAKTQKATRKFTKHGFKKTRGRPADTSRSGLPKIYPADVRPHLTLLGKK
jgi:hypothetical protein